MLNPFKKKEVITYYEGDLSYEEIESRLTTEQTWGTDKKIYRFFFDHLKLKTPVLEFQSIIQKQPKKLFKLAYYYIITQYWYHFSGIYYEDINYKDTFFYFLREKDIKKSQIYHPKTQKIAYFYLNRIKAVN
jgi:hypothetical protein